MQFSHSSSEDNSSFGSPKEAQEKILRNSNIFKQQGDQAKTVCSKHPNKRRQAKYYSQNDRSNRFCSKCALGMALMGLKIEETPSDEGNTNSINFVELLRKERIGVFTNQLRQIIVDCECRFTHLSDTQNSLKQSYNSQRDRCTQYFDLMITRLGQLKQVYLSRLSSTFTNQLQELQSIATTLKSSETQLKQFMVDIEGNHENIVKRMEMKPFAEIMGRYERRVDEHTKVMEGLASPPPSSEIAVLTRETLETEINGLCERLLKHNNDDEVYQSTCSNSLQRSHSNIKLNKPAHSPMRLPPFPKSQHGQTGSRKDSGPNTPDSSKAPRKPTAATTPTDDAPSQKTIVKVASQVEESQSQESPSRKAEFFHTENPATLNNIALQLKIGLHHIREEQQKNKTPTHLKQQSYQPIMQQTSLNSSQCKNSSAKSIDRPSNKELPLQMWSQADPTQLQSLSQKNKSTESQSIYNSSSGLQIQRKIQCNKRSLSKGPPQPAMEPSRSEGKRQFLLPQEHQHEESLKDRIFKELSGGGSTANGESIYNQVLKINQKKQQRFIKEKENFLSTDWASQSLKKNTYLKK